MKEIQTHAYLKPTVDRMLVKIVEVPSALDAELFNLRRAHVGEIRDVGPRVGEYLLACGYAEPFDDHGAPRHCH